MRLGRGKEIVMRGGRGVSVLAVAALAIGVVAMPGCGAQRAEQHQSRPAPTNPDLGDVLERYYEDVEGRHWEIAYAMLSPRLRASMSEAAFEARYAPYANADVTVGQPDGRRVAVHLSDAAHHLSTTERVTLAWDGEDWTIDRLDRTR